MTESQIQEMLADFLRNKYPDVLFHSDFGSGVKLTMGQAVRQKRLNGGRRAWPDLFIAKPKFVHENHGRWVHGLFIELKKDGTRLKKKNGEWASGHIAEQAAVLEELASAGYRTDFAVGYDKAVAIIEEYLN